VDLKGHLESHFTAELLHDVPVIGPLFSFVTLPVGKIFECKVTGTWSNPKVRSLYLNVPQKFFQYMLHPFHSMENFEINKNRNNPQQQPAP
jgi:hypothetical protein